MLQEIEKHLALIDAPGSFATCRLAPFEDLHLEVDGVGKIRKKLRRNDVEAAQHLAQRLLPFWPSAARRYERPQLLSRALEIASKLDPEIAAALLEPFALTAMKSKSAPRIAAA